MNTRAQSLAKALNGHAAGTARWMARCPAHEDGTPSLSIAQVEDRVLVHCHAGCGQERLLQVLRQRGLWCASPRARHASPPRPREKSTPSVAAELIWNGARGLRGTAGETWLRTRGLDLPDTTALRFHPGLRHREDGGCWPAMVARVCDGLDGTPQAIHRTFLRRDGKAKAPVSTPRLALGPLRGGAVRLAPAGETLMVGEGIETCLAAMQSTALPAWSALSTSGLMALALPPEVRTVIILADGDDPGERAARSAAQRWRDEGRTARIARPPRGMDFNDVLLRGRSLPPEGEGGAQRRMGDVEDGLPRSDSTSSNFPLRGKEARRA